MRTACVVLLFAALSACASATAPMQDGALSIPQAEDSSVQVMVLGSTHLAGSSRDVANTDGVNVFTPERQAELEVMTAALAEFNPTVIAVERVTDAPQYIDPKFTDYTPVTLAENANERVQIAYRLANKTDVARVYGIDEQPSDGEPSYFPFGKLMEHAEATGQGDEIQAQIADVQAIVAREAERQASMSMAEMYIAINTGVASGHDFYYETFRYDRGEDQPGAELQAYWFMRNAKIFSKLMQVTKPGDRVVVVYGAGHKYWLEHFAENTPGFVMVDPVEYLERALEQN